MVVVDYFGHIGLRSHRALPRAERTESVALVDLT